MRFLAQKLPGGCGPCSFIMVASHFDPACDLEEQDVMDRFGHAQRQPPCFDAAVSFSRAAASAGLQSRVKVLSRDELRAHLRDGPVILFHRASEAEDALPHFSVAVSASDEGIVRHDPGIGPNVFDTWDGFEGLWSRAEVHFYPYTGNWAVLLRPRPDD